MELAKGNAQKAADLAQHTTSVGGGMLIRLYALTELARALSALGQVQAAVAPAREALELLDRLGHLDEQESDVRVGAAEVFLAAGLVEDAKAQIGVAERRVLEEAGTMPNERWRDGFLTRVRSNVRALELARELWGSANRSPQP